MFKVTPLMNIDSEQIVYELIDGGLIETRFSIIRICENEYALYSNNELVLQGRWGKICKELNCLN